jgi:hypothetical protein
MDDVTPTSIVQENRFGSSKPPLSLQTESRARTRCMVYRKYDKIMGRSSSRPSRPRRTSGRKSASSNTLSRSRTRRIRQTSILARRLSSSWLHDIHPNRKNSPFAESQPSRSRMTWPRRQRSAANSRPSLSRSHNEYASSHLGG